MLFVWIAAIFIFILLSKEEIYLLRRYREQKLKNKEELWEKYQNQRKEEEALKEKVEDLETKAQEVFFFYDLTRKIAPLLNKKELFSIFSAEIKHLGQIEEVTFGEAQGGGILKFNLGGEGSEVLCLKVKSKKVIEYLPHVIKLLSLCVERINLYGKLAQLSIHDSLTELYNRRYFTERFMEEFERAKKFKLNISFLMIDIDHFKKINDTYGHLVGDVVLKEIAKLIKENTRDIDFAARYGGEEFSIILPETNKEGAIEAAERICAKVSGQKIRAFDESLAVTVSAGAATFPQNTLYSDVLIEVADKALYKAKISGRNRVCWF